VVRQLTSPPVRRDRPVENPALGLAGFSSTVMQITITDRAAFERVFHAQSSLILWPYVDSPKAESVQDYLVATARGAAPVLGFQPAGSSVGCRLGASGK
jgi:hypothetical protein